MSTNYQFVDFNGGYGATSAQDVDELNKALSAGAGYSGAPTALTDGGALQVESLDASLKSVTYELKNIRMWQMIAKDQAYNTIEQYNRQDAYGDQGMGFISEGDLPRSEDSSYSRQIQRVRFVGVTRELTHVYTLVRNAHGDAIAREIRNGTMRILQIVERALFDGRGHYSNAGKFDGSASILDSASGDLKWEGLDIQIRAGQGDSTARASAFEGYELLDDVVIDQRGATLDEDALEDAARRVMENFGMPNLMQLDTKSHSDLSRTFYPKERINPIGVANGQAGYVLQQFVSSAGTFDLVGNVFLSPKRGAQPVSGVTAPAAATETASVAAVADSKWSAAEAGDYTYRVSAITKDGESALSPSSGAATVIADGDVDLAIPATANAYAYAVFRSVKDADAGHQFIGYAAPAALGGSATFKDLNHKLPGLPQAYLMSNEAEVVRFKQLAPLMKMDLAIIATAYRWMQLLYGTPIVYAPRKNVILENIGRA